MRRYGIRNENLHARCVAGDDRSIMTAEGDRFARRVFWASGMFLMLSYGVIAGMFRLFPYSVFANAVQGYVELGLPLGRSDEHRRGTWYYLEVPRGGPPPIQNRGFATPGVNLVTQIDADLALCVKVMDNDGRTLQRWDIDWFEIWPDADHVPQRLVPRARPGTHVNGAALLADGDLVFNFEHLGLVRLDPTGRVVWRLAYQTHHSIHVDASGDLWVCGQKEHTEPSPRFPNQVPPFVEDTIVVVSPEGRVVREWSVPELLRSNGLQGLLHLGSLDNFSTLVVGDVTHLNHVEPFPAGMREGFFARSDVLVSLRNVNTVFTFDRDADRITFVCTGRFVRQHDPHFVDGDTISVFDNNNIGPRSMAQYSRILLIRGRDQSVTTYFGGAPEQPFFTPILGRHQWLPNGHLLVTDSCEGRAFEVDRSGRPVWSYVNYVDEGVVGIVEQVQRLPVRYARLFER